MKNRTNQRLEEITAGTLIVGVDVAKSLQWARFVDYRGVEIGKAISFKNNRQGFESIVARIREICNMKMLRHPIEQAIIFVCIFALTCKKLPIVVLLSYDWALLGNVRFLWFSTFRRRGASSV